MKFLRYAAAAVALFSVTPASAATLIGETMEVSYRFPDVDTVYPFASPSVSPFTVGAGVETVVDVESVTDIAVDFGANSLLITFNTPFTGLAWAQSSFNGLLFQGPGAAKIVGASVASTSLAGFDNSRFYFSGGDFGLNWQGLSYADGAQIAVDLNLTPNPNPVIPEPATWLMLIIGFGVIGAALRQRRRRSSYA